MVPDYGRSLTIYGTNCKLYMEDHRPYMTPNYGRSLTIYGTKLWQIIDHIWH